MDLERSTSWQGRTVRWSRMGSGPALVLCHGTPWSSQVLLPVAEVLAERHTVHLWDMPGYGGSSKEEAHDVSLATQAEVLISLLRTWGLDAPRVVAHDIGGAVALRAHLLHGADFASLALVDAVVRRPWGSPLYQLIQQHADVFAQLPGQMHRALLREYLSGASVASLPDDVMETLMRPWLGDVGQAAFYRQIEQVRHAHTDDLEPHVASVRCRTRVFWGEGDRWLPVEQGHALAARLPEAECITFADAGHLLPLERGPELAAGIEAWWCGP